MLAEDLRALDRLAAAGALTPEELSRARARVIQAFLVAPVAPPAAPAPRAVAPAPGGPARPVTGVPRYFGKVPPRMVPVVLATGAGLAAGVATGEGIDALADPATVDGATGGDVGGGAFGG